MRPLFRALALFAFVATSGCLQSEVDESPFEPDPIFQDSSEIFTDTLSPQGSKMKVFVLTFQAQTRVTLASLTSGATALSVPLVLTFGTPSADATTCTPTSTVTVTPALTTQITQELVTGTYCVGIADAGSLTGDVTFAVRIRKSLAPPDFGKAGTDTISTNLYPGGKINRTFGVTASGEVKLALTGVNPQATLGLGIGVTQDTFDDCYLNKIVVTTAGSQPQLTANVEPGIYCVKVFDPGGLPDRVTFSASITHP
jgi:hypothetical protein